MAARGLVEVEKAKNDGRRDAAYEPQSTAKIPEDFREALNKTSESEDAFRNPRGRKPIRNYLQDSGRKNCENARGADREVHLHA